MKTFDQALTEIRANSIREDDSINTTKRGFDFEKLIVEYLKHDPLYSSRYDDVKRWYDYYQEIDTGVDIIARRKDGTLEAIQCKCNDDNATLNMDKISTTFTTAAAKKITNITVVFTGDTVTNNAQKRCEEAGVTIIMKSDLRKSLFDWDVGAKRVKPEPLPLMDHQKEAIQKTIDGFENADRGQLIMACGTGKTLTSLHIAERQVGVGGLVLYLVPSLSLIPQAMREWADNRTIQHQYMAVCSDGTAGKDEQGSITEIPIQPSTNVDSIKDELTRMRKKDGMRVVFSTYNSVERTAEALRLHDTNGKFDLILFDEAHRTTGAEGIKESFYLKAHSDDNVPAKKRLYMTATPRVYAGKGRSDATDKGLEVYSMDDVKKYGEVFYKLSFSEAVKLNLLSSYKLVMREVDQGDSYGEFIRAARQQGDGTEDYGDMDLGYMAKIGGICKAITYPDGDDTPPRPLQRVMVFHNTIRKSRLFSAHGMNLDKSKKPLKLDKTTQKILSFDNVADRLLRTDKQLDGYKTVTRHVDGSTNSRTRGVRIDWLRASSNEPNEIRVLSNARCLQEGVDVPALDAVAFMEPRNSPIDIIQSIGRVMRRAEGKDAGYIIIPIPILKGDDPNYVLNKNRRYEQINKILQAIVAHDDELQRMLNMAVLRRTTKGGTHLPPDPDEIPHSLKEWVNNTLGDDTSDELLRDVTTVMLSLGDKSYHSNMGERLGEQAVIIQTIIQERVGVEQETARTIDDLHTSLQHIVGVTLTKQQTIKALAQHAVTSKIFDVMFPENHNPVAAAFNRVLEKLNVQEQLKEFEAFYLGVQADIERFTEPDAKQDFIRAIYDSFFRGADKKSATKHGIVHTPIEVVNFILDSVQHVLRTEFKKSYSSDTVKVLDPFTGTGIFISQLLERGMISPDALRDKYLHDIYASEIMLPAFYVAMSNIETSYQKVSGQYVPFDGISYMDTFAQHPLYREDSRYRARQTRLGDPDLKEAKARTKRQGMDAINVIIGNPPYSGGQESAHEDNPNISHPKLEQLIIETYRKAIPRKMTRTAALFNSYVKALRWASDRIGNSGVIGFITPSAWLSGNVEAGIRACMHEEFTDVYCFDLLGQKGIPGHGRNIFEYKGSSEGGTTVSTTIVILVKNPNKKECTIHYASLSDAEYEGEQKRDKVKSLKDISHVEWGQPITPDRYHDWLDQRGELDSEWVKMSIMGSKAGKSGKENTIFGTYSNGISTGRDGWLYNSSKRELSKNMKRHIDYCNSQNLDSPKIDPHQAKWTAELSGSLARLPAKPMFKGDLIRTALYRPFFKQYVYFEKKAFIHRPYRIPTFYPVGDAENLSILVSDKIKGEPSAIITDVTPDLHVHEASQAFPLKTKIQSHENIRQVGRLQTPDSRLQTPDSRLQTPNSKLQESGDNSTGQDQGRVLGLHNEYDTGLGGGSPRAGLSDEGDDMKDNITDWALEQYRQIYKDDTITKQDIFYYTYGVLHSPGFREKYQSFLVRGIPNIPYAPNFRAFEKAGRKLAYLHLNYETCPWYGLGEPLHPIPDQPKKIAFGTKPNDGPGPKTTKDTSKLLLEGVLVYDNLPTTTYKVNGRTPVGWFVDRYKHSVDMKGKSGNTNYPLEGHTGEEVRAIIERLVYVGVESDRIIQSLPKEFEMEVAVRRDTLDVWN